MGARSTTLKVHSYRSQLDRSQRARDRLTHPFHPTLFTGWDNTARRGRSALVMVDDEARWLGGALREFIEDIADRPFDERLIFVSAWNEWAEGNYLEPDLDRGLEKLEAIREVVLVDDRAVRQTVQAERPPAG
jgi:hypothetical protein